MQGADDALASLGDGKDAPKLSSKTGVMRVSFTRCYALKFGKGHAGLHADFSGSCHLENQ